MTGCKPCPNKILFTTNQRLQVNSISDRVVAQVSNYLKQEARYKQKASRTQGSIAGQFVVVVRSCLQIKDRGARSAWVCAPLARSPMRLSASRAGLEAADARRISLSYPQGWNLMLHISDFFS
jgi:hypothetical protein